MAAILKEEPPRLSTAGVQLPPALERVVRRLIAKVPAERYPTARALLADLEGPAAAHGSNVSGISGGASATSRSAGFGSSAGSGGSGRWVAPASAWRPRRRRSPCCRSPT